MHRELRGKSVTLDHADGYVVLNGEAIDGEKRVARDDCTYAEAQAYGDTWSFSYPGGDNLGLLLRTPDQPYYAEIRPGCGLDTRKVESRSDRLVAIHDLPESLFSDLTGWKKASVDLH